MSEEMINPEVVQDREPTVQPDIPEIKPRDSWPEVRERADELDGRTD